MKIIQIFLYPADNLRNFSQYFFIIIRQFSALRHYTAEIFLRQHQCAVDEVAVNSHQLTVIPGLKILPGKIVVFGFGSIGCQYIPQHILFAFEVTQIFMQPYGPIPGSRNLVSFQIQKLIGRHIIGQYITTFCFQHRRENNTMEYNIIFPDKMDHPGFGILPIFFPFRSQIFRCRNVSDRSIEPDIEHLSFRFIERYGHPPIQIAGHGTGL